MPADTGQILSVLLFVKPCHTNAQRNEELQKLTALNAHLLHDNMVLHTSLALLIDRQPTIVTGLYETDMICWVVPNLALLAREGKLPRRIVSPWLKSENRRTCRLQFILYPFGTKHDHREALAGKPDSRLATPRKACPALLVRMKRNVEATFYLFFGKQCTSPVTYQFSESVGGGRSFYRHDFSSTWLDDLGYPGQDTFHVGLSLLHCSDRSQYVIRHHDRHYADLQPRCLRLS
ncbi:conserved hypothetical protein [Neospora caninum Liverpool]|uniref:Uncharacterized protein n=1 Tax=Neospora caninum (strain Liverpool) TaxID=572307 RepID=F0V7R7_NEOCL|nr:conserved hypothetical protein [Neospora caninum Liverpool]CBZ49758.1 conserved hypothetical protein [Neospora caninum Liverpool]|eukprot:XP_003879793.1 conserved hypothetical protein [Neospora caninum Liverpool]